MSRNASQFRLIVVLCLAGAAALLLPPETTAGWRAALRDALVPGQMAAHALWNRADDALAGAAGRDSFNRELEDLRNQLAAAESHSRRLELETAQLRQRTEQTLAQYAGYFAIDRREPLFQTALLEARVLGEDASSLWRTRMTIQAGSSAGVVESSLVLNDDRPLLDVGDDGGLHPGDAVYAGRIVLGKVADVGRW
jgi:cell shape-determining protein MreC